MRVDWRLDPERGYHLTHCCLTPSISHSVSFVHFGFVQANMTPFAKQCLSEMAPKYYIELFQVGAPVADAAGARELQAGGVSGPGSAALCSRPGGPLVPQHQHTAPAWLHGCGMAVQPTVGADPLLGPPAGG